MVKFLRFKQKEALKQAAPSALKGTSFGVNEQFPKEIAERRRQLLPIMKEHKRNGLRATLAFDKLHTDSATFIVKEISVKRIDKRQQHQSFRHQNQTSDKNQLQKSYGNHKNNIPLSQAVNNGQGASSVPDDMRSLNSFPVLTPATTAINA